MPRPELVAYAESQNALFDKLDAGVAKVAADVEWQKKELERWNNLPPTWTAEDQSILDGLVAATQPPARMSPQSMRWWTTVRLFLTRPPIRHRRRRNLSAGSAKAGWIRAAGGF